MFSPSRFQFGQHRVRFVTLNGAFWFLSDDLAPCLGMSQAELQGLNKHLVRKFPQRLSRLIEMDQPDGTLKMCRIYSRPGIVLLATRLKNRRPEEFLEGFEVALARHFQALIPSQQPGILVNVEECITGVLQSLRCVINMIGTNRSGDRPGLEPSTLIGLLGMIHRELAAAPPDNPGQSIHTCGTC